jgi:hypothetical protein
MRSRSRQAEVAAEVAGLSLLSHTVLVQQIAEGGQVCVVDQDRQRWLLKWQV